MHTLLKNYKPGMTYDEAPFFYETMDKESGDLMHATTDEVQLIAKAMRNLGMEVNPPTIFDYEAESYMEPGLTRVNEIFSHSPGISSLLLSLPPPFLLLPFFLLRNSPPFTLLLHLLLSSSCDSPLLPLFLLSFLLLFLSTLL